MSAELHCPVCQARFRGVRICSPCGADLGPLMRLAVKAWRLREAARRALDQGDVDRARGLASAAQHVHRTPAGASLRRLSEWLMADRSGHARPDADPDRDLNRA